MIPRVAGYNTTMPKRAKRPRDPNLLGKLVVDLATGAIEEPKLDDKKRALIEARRKGGLKGGKSRAKALTVEQKAEIAASAARARWKKRRT